MSVNRENRLRIALTKGRLLDKSVELFTAMGCLLYTSPSPRDCS